jgi:hypothetical protein
MRVFERERKSPAWKVRIGAQTLYSGWDLDVHLVEINAVA